MTTESEPAPAESLREDRESPWLGLHPVSPWVNLVPQAWSTFRRFGFFLVVALISRGANGQSWSNLGFDFFLLGTFFSVAVLQTAVHYLTLGYRVTQGRLEIRTGLLQRQIRTISAEKIQNVERVQNLFQRWAGLEEVRVETASGSEVEGLLSALGHAQASALIGDLERIRQGGGVTPAEGPPEEEIYPNDSWDLLRHGVTSVRLGAVAVLFGIGFELTQWVDPERIAGVTSRFGWGGAAIALMASFSGAWVFATASSWIQHYGFRLIRRGATLVASEGLFTRRRSELPLPRIQLVRIEEPLVRRILGFGSVGLETASTRVGAEGATQAEAEVPVVDQDDYDALVGVALPGMGWSAGSPLEAVPARALWSVVLAQVLRLAFFVAIPTAIFSWWWLGLWALAPVVVLAAWLDIQAQGFSVGDQLLVARQGFWTRRVEIVDRSKIQTVDLVSGPLQRWLGLSTVVVKIAGSALVLPQMLSSRAAAVHAELRRGVRRPPPARPLAADPVPHNDLVFSPDSSPDPA